MNKSLTFDKTIQSDCTIDGPPVNNLAELIFTPLEHRSEEGEVLLGHDNMNFIRVSLKRFRFIHSRLYARFKEENFQPGDTILLASVPGNNELFQALLFSALASYGIRVLMPMFMETDVLDNWLITTRCKAAILPESDIYQLKRHQREKDIVKRIRLKISEYNLPCYDSITSFGLRKLLTDDMGGYNGQDHALVESVVQNTHYDQEALIITTSGSTGQSNLVVYKQAGFIKSCLSWQKAGMLDKNVLGGRGFTPLFTHTMGIRTFYNALWTANPACLINTEWFEEHPEIVRYLLMKMKPEHITGGPAAYELLLEMMRNYPELTGTFRSSFKTLVSSGAPFNPGLMQDIQSVFDLPVHNALGTTETQQVTNTLLTDTTKNPGSGCLGLPLPGVELGLKKFGMDNLYELYINSPFGCSRILNGAEEAFIDDYFRTGDLVDLVEGQIVFAGRAEKDYFKDGFGVKIPIRQVRSYYRHIAEHVVYIDFHTLQGEPGLAALIFVRIPSLKPGIVTSKTLADTFKARFETVNNRLFSELNPFEYRHRTVKRFVLVNDAPPETAKGNISSRSIQQRYASLLTSMRKYFASAPWITTIDVLQADYDAYTEHANAYVGRMLRDLKMDLVYHRAGKDSLYSYREGRETEILDFVGGFGCTLLGLYPDELKQAREQFLRANAVALTNQGSIQTEVGQLAELLNEMIGRETNRNYRVLLGSTGAEAVEMAVQHATLEWRKLVEKHKQRQFQRFGASADHLVREVWDYNLKLAETARLNVVTLKNAFHGYTSAARSLIGNPEQRTYFSNLSGIDPVFIDDASPDWKETLHRKLKHTYIDLKWLVASKGKIEVTNRAVSTVIAALVEPVTGEGGVRVVNREFLHYLSSFDFPLIFDEIQCGLGRTGHLLASNGIPGDYYLLGKALGGGLEKISAVLIDKQRYIPEFGKYYATTFGNGEAAAKVACATLSLIKKLDIPKQAAMKGRQLKGRLEQVAARYPEIFDRIDGEGLLLGIRFKDFSQVDNILIRLACNQKFLGYLCASYLLNRHNIRVLPTLSAPNVLRVEPSAFISEPEMDRLAAALDELANQLANRDLYKFFLAFMEGDPFEDKSNVAPPNGFMYRGVDTPAQEAVQVTFLAHFVHPTDELRILEPSFIQASDTGLCLLFNHLQALLEMKPVTLFSKNIFGGRIHFQMKIIPVSSAVLEQMHRKGKKRTVIKNIQKAVDEAASEGARVVALGAYTSIFTNNGLDLAEPEGVRIITGNTLTAASGIARLLHELRNNGTAPERSTLGIVGAAGNIGGAITTQMLKRHQEFNKVILVVHNQKQKADLSQYLREYRPPAGQEPELICTTDLDYLKLCNAIVITTNSNKPLVFPQHIKPDGPVLISDNSVPTAVSDEVIRMPQVRLIPFSSYIKLPEDPDFVISSHTQKGTVFCCAAEAVLCGLEKVTLPLRGPIEERSIELMEKLAIKWGLLGEFGTVSSFKSYAKT